MHIVLDESFAASFQQTSLFGDGSLIFAQMNLAPHTWVTVGAIGVGFALAWILTRIWSIKAMPKAIFILFFVAMFSSLTGSVYRYVQADQPAQTASQWATLVYKIQTDDSADNDTDGKKWSELADRIYARLQRPFSSENLHVEASGNNQITISFPLTDNLSVERVKKALSFNGVLEFRIAASRLEDRHTKLIELSQDSKSNVITDPESKAPIGEWLECNKDGTLNQSWTSLITRPDPQNADSLQGLVYNDKNSVTGTDLDYAYQTYDESARPAVGFALNQAGTTKFGKLTSKYAKGKEIPDDQKNHLVIILDSTIQSAPSLNEAITGGTGIISGVEPENVPFIVAILSEGQWPMKVEKTPVSESVGKPPEKYLDRGKNIYTITALSVLLFSFLVISFFLANRKPRDEIPLAQLSPTT